MLYLSLNEVSVSIKLFHGLADKTGWTDACRNAEDSIFTKGGLRTILQIYRNDEFNELRSLPIKRCPDSNLDDHPLQKPDIPKLSSLKKAERLFRALRDIHRLRLLLLLAQREWCVSELVESLSENFSTISQRLRLLRSENLVEPRREGSHVYYSLADQYILKLLNMALEHAGEPKSPFVPDHRNPQKPQRKESRV
jgi:ArsR family transcriptional regulator, lead/cadmium/zinc/bismuth-responsive transcriptional repressor